VLVMNPEQARRTALSLLDTADKVQELLDEQD
jgi:hypothetical protein